MKKTLLILLALSIVGAAAFADAPVAAWSVTGLYGFGISMPSTGTFITPYDYSQVGLNRTRLDLKLTSADGNTGFTSETQLQSIVAPNTNWNAGNTVWSRWNVWGKLFNGMLTVKAGQGDDYSVATKDWYSFGTTDGGSYSYAAPGISFILAPIDGLKILFHQVFLQPAANIYGDIIGLSYTAAGLGGVQVGIMPLDQASTSGNNVYFGFNVTAVENLTAILEGNVSLGKDDSPLTLEQNIGYTMGALTVGARVGEYNDKASGFSWGVEPTVSYKLMDNFTVNAIVNVYDYQVLGHLGNTVFMSPIDVGVVNPGDPNTINVGFGVSANYTMGGFVLTVGDYYGAGKNAGNFIYVNADLSL